MENNDFTRPSNDLIGDILKKHAEEGGMENLEGQGKPLREDYFSGDLFQHFQKIAKDAGFKPHWLKLQHAIRDELKDITEKYINGQTAELQFRVTKVNERIMEYNKSCPPPMQKGIVRLETIEMASRQW